MELINEKVTNSQSQVFADIDNMPNHLRLPYGDDMRQALTLLDGKGINNIVVCGMGGSALAGNLAKNWLFSRLQVPLEVVRGSSVPGYVNEHSLVIVSSYSGDTAETIKAYTQAVKNNAQILVLTSGGALYTHAEAQNQTVLRLPKCDQPRFAVFAGLRALTCALQNMGLIGETDSARELEDTADFLDEAKMLLSPDVEKSNQAKELAKKHTQSQNLIYASPLLSSAAYIWKISINENAKQAAWYNTYSELDHNELEGWQFPKQKDIAGIQLVSKFESAEMKKRIELTTKLLHSEGVVLEPVEIAGSTHLQELLFTSMLGNFYAAYLAVENGVDPEQVKIVSKLKTQLKKAI